MLIEPQQSAEGGPGQDLSPAMSLVNFAPTHEDVTRHRLPARTKFLGHSRTRTGQPLAIYECETCGYRLGYVPHWNGGTPHLLCKGLNLQVEGAESTRREIRKTAPVPAAKIEGPAVDDTTPLAPSTEPRHVASSAETLPPWLKRLRHRHWDRHRHWLPGTFRFVGETLSAKGQAVAVYECDRCAHVAAIAVDRFSGRPIILFERD